MKRAPGQLTVFLSLISLLVVSLLLVSLESARAAGLSYLSQQASGSALQSVLAEFNSSVLDRYGLLLCDGSQAESKALKYASRYFTSDSGPLAQLGEVAVSVEDWEILRITDDNGRVFADQVLQYMKGAGMSLIFQELLTRLGIRQLSDLSSLAGTVSRLLEGDSFDLKSLFSRLEQIRQQAAEKEPEESSDSGSPSEGSSQTGAGLEEFFGDAESISDYLDRLKDLKEHGLIYYLTGRYSLSPGVSGPTVPSQPSAQDKSRNEGRGMTEFSLTDRLLLTEYAMHKLSCYTSQASSGCRYELEYILSGKTTDQNALQEVAGELVMLRAGLNLSYLLGDAARLEQAEAAALVLCTALGIPELSATVKWLVAAAWSLAEGLSDVKALLKGSRVPLWKTEGSWETGLLELPGDRKLSGSGLSYADYLRLLCLLKQGPTLCYRIMDVIQRRTRTEASSFLMAEQLVHIQADFSYTARTLYLITPVFSEPSSDKAWKYTKKASAGYERR